jgi:hypothetical protein
VAADRAPVMSESLKDNRLALRDILFLKPEEQGRIMNEGDTPFHGLPDNFYNEDKRCC